MIKRLTFLPVGAAWSGAVASGPARPLRTTVASVVPGVGDHELRHGCIVTEWFRDDEHLVGTDPPAAGGPAVLVDEVVVRGADWLAERWRVGGPVLQHLALARRADGLSAEEFSAQWRDHAGRVGSGRGVVVIPDDLRGRAYVQNHPRSADRLYDAINEVYFDAEDLDGLRRRVEWFATNAAAVQADDLFGESWFLCLRQEVVG